MAKARSLRTSEVVTRMVRAAAADVRDTLPAALRDEPDAVHEHRTRVRRLRAVLAGVSRYVDASAARRLRDEYREWGHALGVVRDLEVRAEQADAALADAGVDDEDAGRRLVGREREQYVVEHARLEQLASFTAATKRARRLERFAADPHAQGGKARKDLRRVLQHEIKRVRRAERAYDGTLETQHELRKAGRRLRYIAEAIGTQSPGLFEVADLVAAGKGVHDSLGEQRDALLFVARLRLARAAADAAGEAVAPYEQLIEAAESRASDHAKGLKPALKQLRRGAKAIS
jgi:CHAD domain-containing protein